MTNRRLRRGAGALALASLAMLAAVLATAVPALAAGACRAAAAGPAAADPDELEQTVLCLVNRERSRRGLDRLRSEPRLARAARAHSRDMARRDFFSHVSPGGATVMARLADAGYRAGPRGLMVGENIAWGSGAYAAPAHVVESWMESAGHRANILNRSFREIGVGAAAGAPRPVGGQSAATYTTDFGAR